MTSLFSLDLIPWIACACGAEILAFLGLFRAEKWIDRRRARKSG